MGVEGRGREWDQKGGGSPPGSNRSAQTAAAKASSSITCTVAHLVLEAERERQGGMKEVCGL